MNNSNHSTPTPAASTTQQPSQFSATATAESRKKELEKSILLQQEGLTWANISQHLHPDLEIAGGANAQSSPIRPQFSNTSTSLLNAVDNQSEMDTNGMNIDQLDSYAASAATNDILKSPPISRLKKEDMKMFGASPIFEDLFLIQCVDCKKSLLPSSFAEHVRRCRQAIAEGKSNNNSQSPSAVDMQTSAASVRRNNKGGGGKRRKKADDAELEGTEATSSCADNGNDDIMSEDLTKYQDPIPGFTLRRKAARIINLDLQCGVMTPVGIPCTRPLDCHIHSMFAKSLVKGRSKDLKTLLIERMQLISSLDGNSLATNDSHNNVNSLLQNRNNKLLAASSASLNSNTIVEKVLDADKEIDNLIEIIQHHVAEPMVKPQYFSIKRQTVTLRLRDLFMNVLGQTPIVAQEPSLNAMNLTKVPLGNSSIGDLSQLNGNNNNNNLISTNVNSTSNTHLLQIDTSKNSASPAIDLNLSNASLNLNASQPTATTTASPKKKGGGRKKKNADGASPSTTRQRRRKSTNPKTQPAPAAQPDNPVVATNSSNVVPDDPLSSVISINPADLFGGGGKKADPREFKFF